jgi:hypothetical protein
VEDAEGEESTRSTRPPSLDPLEATPGAGHSAINSVQTLWGPHFAHRSTDLKMFKLVSNHITNTVVSKRTSVFKTKSKYRLKNGVKE